MKTETLLALFLMLVVAGFAPDMAYATDVFDAPTGFLTDIKTFIEGPAGVMLGGVVVASAAIMAASPRSQVTWGHFFLVCIVLAVFYGAFKIAETMQSAYK